jgi:hypothetical protein
LNLVYKFCNVMFFAFPRIISSPDTDENYCCSVIAKGN